jgi:hypothetical protein
VQTQPASGIWKGFGAGDGGNVGVDANQTAHPGTTIRYTSATFLLDFIRSVWDANNNLLSSTYLLLPIVAGPGAGSYIYLDPSVQFNNPMVLNSVDPTRLLIGTKTLYESFDQANTWTNLNYSNGSYVGGAPNFYHATGEPLVYGGYLDGVANPDVIWAGIGSQVVYREHLGDPLQVVPGYKGSFVQTIVAGPQDYRRIFVVDDANQVWISFDAGQSFQNITGNLLQHTAFLNSLEVVSQGSSSANEMLVAGAANGAFSLGLNGNAPRSWSPLGVNLPHVIVADLHFYPAENLLLAGTLGRGAWTLTDPFGDTGTPATNSLAASSAMVPLAPTVSQLVFAGQSVLHAAQNSSSATTMAAGANPNLRAAVAIPPAARAKSGNKLFGSANALTSGSASESVLDRLFAELGSDLRK